ncbi:hypothetical protein HK098_007078, partial [Nowakowskiella sp. JEL0407]
LEVIEVNGTAGIPETDLLDAIELLAKCWDNVLVETIKHCFANTGIFPDKYKEILRSATLPSEDVMGDLINAIGRLNITKEDQLSASEF